MTTFDEAAKMQSFLRESEAKIADAKHVGPTLTEEEKRLLADTDIVPGGDPADQPDPAQDVSALPSWVVIPDGLRMPPPGRRLVAIKFEPDITERQDLGDRWCLCWSLSLQEERAATTRMRGDPTRFTYEMSKQMLRVIDGRPVDWSGAIDGKYGVNPDLFMDQIGFIGREMIAMTFQRLHNLTPERRLDFHARCMVFRNT